NEGATPLHYAARDGRKELTELLLTDKADVNATDNSGYTPLYYAAYEGHNETAELLIANKADVNAKDKDGETSLHAAALHGYNDVVELLLANKADVNVRDSDGNTPLHNAASVNYPDVAKLLLASGADADAKNKDGRTPLQVAAVQPVTQTFTAIDKIVILPVVDSRTDKKAKVNLQNIRKSTAEILKLKHYSVAQAESAPPEARWVMIVNLYNLAGRIPIASLSASLCEKENQAPSVIALLDAACSSYGSAVWYGGGMGAYTFGPQYPQQAYGAAGQLADLTTIFLMPGSARNQALGNALAKVLSTIPRMPKKKKK
ncbi:MAG: ankyrin repeat domain-containing protein, partial [Acidobacteriaceae bacterium]|nr:ankyrin repeat domain-containing protein [Acidobacteriaceae bacterium]